MRKITLFILLLVSFFLLSDFPVGASRGVSVISDLSHQSGKLGAYQALIIGINNYKDPMISDLATAVNDAKAMAKLLRERYGFQVKLLLDRKATKEAIYRALRRLASSTKLDDSVLIYYAGHGDLDRIYDDGWWIPADAKGGDPLTYLDNVLVQKSMRSMKARHVLLISDSCYSGTLFGKARSLPPVINDKYYLSLYNEKSRWGMTSGNKTPVADEGTGGHSVFAYQLIKELRKNEKPYVSTQEIYTRIAPIVGNNSEQIPLCRPIRNTGDQGGEFVFVASSGGAAAVQKSISVKTFPGQLPPEVGVSFDDILKAEEVQRQAKEEWKRWQQVREKEYRSIRSIDESKNLTSQQKTVAWQRFLAAVSQDNPYSRQDDEMRSYSRSRLNHWQSVKPPDGRHGVRIPENPGNHVVDLAGIIDNSTEAKLNQYLRELEQKTTVQIAILTIKSLEGESIEDLSITVAHDKWKLGQKGKDNGVLLLVSINDRKYRIEIGYGLEGVIPNSLVGNLGRSYLVPFFRKGEYSNGIYAASLALANEIAKDSGVKITGMPHKK